MRKFIGLILAAVLLVGCSGLLSKNQGVNGKASKEEDKQRLRIEQTQKDLSTNSISRLTKIGEYSYGIDYTLKGSTNSESLIAYDINKRIFALSEKPSFSSMLEMEKLVNDLQTNNTRRLEEKDKEISYLQNKVLSLEFQKDLETQKYIKLADATAGKADQYKETLKDMDSMFGLGAIFYGFKKLFISLTWFFVIGGLIYLFLRIASMSNPIAASIFNIFNLIGSWFINLIKLMTPKATDAAHLVSTQSYNLLKDTLKHIVDAVEATKSDTIKEEVAKSMDSTHKEVIQNLKKELLYK